mgnify:CR=1 FL=1
MPRTPKPYLTTTPWQLFTPRERKRAAVLTQCPSARCRRAKACVDAHDNIYCQRSHKSVAEARGGKRVAVKPLRLTLAAVRAKLAETDIMLADAEARQALMTERWKSGEFDALYGKYNARGVLKVPPVRQYTE